MAFALGGFAQDNSRILFLDAGQVPKVRRLAVLVTARADQWTAYETCRLLLQDVLTISLFPGRSLTEPRSFMGDGNVRLTTRHVL